MLEKQETHQQPEFGNINILHKKETETELVKHFINQSNPLWTDIERKKRERQWIYLLSTKSPNGLNKK